MDESYKQFDKKLCEENDRLAKSVALNFLLYTKKFKCHENIESQPEMYKAWDFILYDPTGVPITFEVERKKVWTKIGRWQGWPTVDVPARKNRSKADYFIMINNTGDTLAMTSMSVIHNSPVTNKKTIYTSNEPFFNIPLTKIKFYHNVNNTWGFVPPNGY